MNIPKILSHMIQHESWWSLRNAQHIDRESLLRSFEQTAQQHLNKHSTCWKLVHWTNPVHLHSALVISSIILCLQSCNILSWDTFLRHFEIQKLWEELSCTSYIVSQISIDDVHINYFHRRQSPACLQSWNQLNLAGKPAAVNAWHRLCICDKYSHMSQRCPRPCRRHMRSRVKIQANFWLCEGLSLTSRDERM